MIPIPGSIIRSHEYSELAIIKAKEQKNRELFLSSFIYANFSIDIILCYIFSSLSLE